LTNFADKKLTNSAKNSGAFMTSPTQCSIEAVETGAGFRIFKHEESGATEVGESFDSYEKALDFLLAQGWQLQRAPHPESLIMESRFRKL